MLIAEYNARQGVDPRSETYQILSENEMKRGERYASVDTMGKQDKMVCVTINRAREKAINKLLECRGLAGFDEDNPHVFPAHSKVQPFLRGCNVMTKLSERCGANNPKSLRSSKLRKQLATSMQLLNLRPNELDRVLHFMSHSIGVHDKYYR
jgi:hypothetical protein